MKLETIDNSHFEFKKRNYRFPATTGKFIVEPFENNILFSIQFKRKNSFLVIIPIIIILFIAYFVLIAELMANPQTIMNSKLLVSILITPFIPIGYYWRLKSTESDFLKGIKKFMAENVSSMIIEDSFNI